MKTLKLTDTALDQENSFTFAKFKYHSPCRLCRGYKTHDDGIYWALQTGWCLQSSYSIADIQERDRLRLPESSIEHDEIVQIDGKLYRTEFLGNYSNCAIFHPVE